MICEKFIHNLPCIFFKSELCPIHQRLKWTGVAKTCCQEDHGSGGIPGLNERERRGTVIGTFDSLNQTFWLVLVFLEGSNPYLVESIHLSAVFHWPIWQFGVWFCNRIPLGSSKNFSVENTALVGGFKYFSLSPLAGEMIQFDEHIFNWLETTNTQLGLKSRVFPTWSKWLRRRNNGGVMACIVKVGFFLFGWSWSCVTGEPPCAKSQAAE